MTKYQSFDNLRYGSLSRDSYKSEEDRYMWYIPRDSSLYEMAYGDNGTKSHEANTIIFLLRLAFSGNSSDITDCASLGSIIPALVLAICFCKEIQMLGIHPLVGVVLCFFICIVSLLVIAGLVVLARFGPKIHFSLYRYE